MFEHLMHLAQLQYEKFHNEYGEWLLNSADTTPTWRRSVLKCKTIGLIKYDQTLLQDSRLPKHLKLEH